MSMVTVQATQAFSTYIAGDCVSVMANQMVVLPKDTADQLAKAGLVLPPGRSAPEHKEALKPSRVVSDAVPDPDDATEDEMASTDDAAKGRKRVDPSIARARKVEKELGARGDKQRPAYESGEGPVSEPDAPAREKDPDGLGAGPEGAHTDPDDDGTAAKGSYTTGKEDLSKGPKPASKPIESGQGHDTRKPKATGRGKVAKEGKPESEDPDGEGAPDPIETVGEKEEHFDHTGPKDDPAAGTEGKKGPAVDHPSPGTVEKPSAS